jgi:hypothetical protein
MSYELFGFEVVEKSDESIKENHKTFNVKHCEGCHRSYEMAGNSEIYYHIDFPSYGLERENCINC